MRGRSAKGLRSTACTGGVTRTFRLVEVIENVAIMPDRNWAHDCRFPGGISRGQAW